MNPLELRPWIRDACSDVERWPLIGGIGLFVLGVAGFVVARRLRTRDDEGARP
jgi:hypothetical protein